MDFWAGTCSTTKARILLDQRRSFVGCVLDSELLTAVKAELVSTIASDTFI